MISLNCRKALACGASPEPTCDML